MYYKHYIRIDKSNNITKVFSNAFEQPVEEDILYTSTGERHFYLQLLDENGFYLYKYDTNSNTIIKKTIAENYETPEGLARYKAIKIEQVKVNAYNKLCSTDWKCIRHRDETIDNNKTTLSNKEYKELLDERNKIRKHSDDLENLVNAATTKAEIDAII